MLGPKAIKKREQQKVDNWNNKYPVGQRVVVKKDDNSTFETITTHKATLLSGHTAVIWLEGISGCYDLDRVYAITDNLL